MASISETVASLTSRFTAAGLDTPRLDARVLVAHILDTEPAQLFARGPDPFPDAQAADLEAVVVRRLAHEPVSRIRGTREFWGLSLEIGPATLDPRPDTETLVEAALRHRRAGRPVRMLDLGTGSGSILLALLSSWPEATGVGIDVSAEAVAVATRNAQRHGLAERARFQSGDWCAMLEGPFDVIVSNPPYITDAEMTALAPEVANFDPARALRGGMDGLDAYRAIASQLKSVLAADGMVLFEVGLGQADAVAAILAALGFTKTAFSHDLAGVVRVVAAAASTAQMALEV